MRTSEATYAFRRRARTADLPRIVRGLQTVERRAEGIQLVGEQVPVAIQRHRRGLVTELGAAPPSGGPDLMLRAAGRVPQVVNPEPRRY